MRFLFIIQILLALCSMPTRVTAGVEQVKSRGVVRCGGIERPGLAAVDAHGLPAGLEVDICRAVATAILGSPERIAFQIYQTPNDIGAGPNGQDDIFILTGSEIAEQALAGRLVPGPTVFVESHGIMVPGNARARHIGDLAGDSICYMIGSPVERSLEAYFDSIHRTWLHRAFSEEGEMIDTYRAGNCHAVAGELTTLASQRHGHDTGQPEDRILPETLADFPVMAATGTGDGQWSAIVVWTVSTLISAERPETRWYAGGAGSMPVLAPELGLDAGWQSRVIKTVGSYADIYARNLGRNSALMLDRSLNANHINGGLLLSPFLD